MGMGRVEKIFPEEWTVGIRVQKKEWAQDLWAEEHKQVCVAVS